MVKVTCLLAKAGSGVGLSFGVRALTQIEIRCVKGMFRLKLISSEKNSVFKGLKTGIFPIDRKFARVVPIPKTGNPESPSNYRPISTLPIISKLLEKHDCTQSSSSTP